MKNLITYTRSNLENMKLAQITNINNSFAIELGLKSTKRFASKDKAILRTIKNRDLYVEKFAEYTKGQMHNLITNELDSPVKPILKSSRFNMEAKLSILFDHGKLGSIENSIHTSLVRLAVLDLEPSVANVVEWVIENHKRPRSGRPVNEQYVIHNIKWFVKTGSLKLEE
jgi:hypothetical protein